MREKLDRVISLQDLEIITEDPLILKLMDDLISQNTHTLTSLSVNVLKDTMLKNIIKNTLTEFKVCKSTRINLRLINEKLNIKNMTTLKLHNCTTSKSEDWLDWLD